jgi:hypothetical protein
MIAKICWSLASRAAVIEKRRNASHQAALAEIPQSRN